MKHSAFNTIVKLSWMAKSATLPTLKERVRNKYNILRIWLYLILNTCNALIYRMNRVYMLYAFLIVIAWRFIEFHFWSIRVRVFVL